MELSMTLMQQIGSLFIMMGIGFYLVKKRVCKSQDSRLLSALLLYVAAPCAIINSFQIEKTPDKMGGLGLAILAAISIHIIFIVMSYILGKFFHFNAVEKGCVIYSNCGNLIIPLVTVMLGSEMTFYTSGYMVVQNILMWTHCKFIISEDANFSFKKILFNLNILSVITGVILFMVEIQLPLVASSAIRSLSGLMGPLSMLVVGMLLARMNILSILKQKRAYLVSAFRLLLLPVLVLLFFMISGIANLVSNGEQVLMVSMLAASAPSASTVTQFAQVYNKNASQASVINALSVLLCIITMPLMLMLYTALI